MPKVSDVGIVVVNRDNAGHVRATIESAAHQTVRGLRIVVVDDGSNDGSDLAIRRCLTDLADDRIRYVRLPASLGQAGAIRAGLAELKTTFVSFLSSGDGWFDTFVERHLAAHLNADFPVALTCCEAQDKGSGGRVLSRSEDRGRLAPPRLTFFDAWSRNWSSNGLSTLMFRRDFVNLLLVASNRELRFSVDPYLSAIACLLTGVIRVHEPLVARPLSGPRASATERGAQRDAVLRMIADVLHSHAQPLRSAFGDYSYDRAHALMMRALKRSPVSRIRTGSRRLMDVAIPDRLVQWVLTLKVAR